MEISARWKGGHAMFMLLTLCFRTYFNLTRAVQDKVSTNISREAELQALPEDGVLASSYSSLHFSWCSTITAWRVKWKYRLVFDCRLFEKSWEEFMQIFRLRWRGIGHDRSRVKSRFHGRGRTTPRHRRILQSLMIPMNQ